MMSRAPKRRVRIAKTPPSSKSKTSITETTEQLMAFWRRRFGRATGDCSECDDPASGSKDIYSDLCCEGSPPFPWGPRDADSLLRSRFPERFDVTNQVEFTSCSSSALIFTLMALVSVFVVVSVTVILLRVEPMVNPMASNQDAEPVVAPRDFTLSPRKTERASPRQSFAPRSTRSVQYVARRAFHQTRKQTTSTMMPLAPVTEPATSPMTAANSSRSSSRTIAKAKRVTLADTFADETTRMCSMVLYSYCSRRRQEFYFQSTSNSCVVVSGDTTGVCNHSPNRFTSQRNCKAKCIDNSNPSERCFSTAMFSKCTSRDVRYQWWFYDGAQCVPWDFPEGACPSVQMGGDLFTSAKECASQCATGDALLEPCQPPKPGPCTAKQLRFPYFAMSSPEDRRVDCLRSSISVLSGHRCLTGTNRFLTEASCLQTCSGRSLRISPRRIKGRIGGPEDGNWRTLGDMPKDVFDQDFFSPKVTTRKRFFAGR
ncbi:uncharacterized protein LOC144097793 [Amblyomma americanum]